LGENADGIVGMEKSIQAQKDGIGDLLAKENQAERTKKGGRKEECDQLPDCPEAEAGLAMGWELIVLNCTHSCKCQSKPGLVAQNHAFMTAINIRAFKPPSRHRFAQSQSY
jgi:hypothetical protein